MKITRLIIICLIGLSSCIKPEPCQTCNVPWYSMICEKPGYSFSTSGNAAYMITYYEAYTTMGYSCQYLDSGRELHTCKDYQIKIWKGEGFYCHE